MKFDADTIAKLRELGIDPSTPRSDDLKKLLTAYLQNRGAEFQIVQKYLHAAGPTTKALLDALKACATEQSKLTQQALEIINRAVAICEAELQKDCTPDERKELLDRILHYVQEARQEADQGRSHILRLAMMGCGAVVVVAGVAIAITTRQTGVLKAGARMIARV